jgi:drug/metabolite transporter (DMT)-like permease
MVGNPEKTGGVLTIMTADAREGRSTFWPWVALSTVYVVWGSTYLAIRVVVGEMPPFAAASLRFLSAGVVMAGLAALRDRALPKPRQIAQYSFIGVLFLGISNGLVMWSERTIPSGIAALLVATIPLWITFFDGLRAGGQAWSARIWLSTLVGLAGVALVARPEGGVATGHWPGIIALQVATLTWTAGSLYSQALTERVPVLTAAAIEMLAGSAFLAAVSRLVREDLTAFSMASRGAWAGLAYLAVFGSIVAFTAFAYTLNELPASTVGTYAYVNPVVAVALGAMILGEPVSTGLLAGGALILTAVLLATLKRKIAPDPPVAVPVASAEG